MVTRIHGAPRQGVYFSKDVRFLGVNIGTGTTAFLTDLQVTSTDPRQADVVNSDLEIALELISTRGNVIGLTVVDDDNFNVILDYAQAYDDAAVVAEVTALIDAYDGSTPGLDVADLTATAFTVLEGFGGIALGTPG